MSRLSFKRSHSTLNAIDRKPPPTCPFIYFNNVKDPDKNTGVASSPPFQKVLGVASFSLSASATVSATAAVSSI